MKKYCKVAALALVLLIVVAVAAACGMSNNPNKVKSALEGKQYNVESVIGDNDLDAQAELDSLSDEMGITAGELVAMITATKGEEQDSREFIYIYYFKDSVVADKFWNVNQVKLNELKTQYKDTDGFEINKEGSVVYFGTARAIKDAK